MRAPLVAALVLLPVSSLADSIATPRMSYTKSSAIKREMVEAIHGRMQDFALDHCQPLCLGGSNDRSNLQLQPWPEARQKDQDEVRVCRAVERHRMTQREGFAFFRQLWNCK